MTKAKVKELEVVVTRSTDYWADLDNVKVEYGIEGFSVNLDTTHCCGVLDVHNWVSSITSQASADKIFAAFFKALEEDHDHQRREGAYLMMVLTRDNEESGCNQPFLETYLQWKAGCTHTPWRLNTNSGNEIQVWMIEY